MEVVKAMKALLKCAAKDEGRYRMDLVKLERDPLPGFEADTGALVATDGRRAVALAVKLDEHDADGYVTREAIEAACKVKRPYGLGAVLEANGSLVVRPGGPAFERPAMGHKSEANPNGVGEFPRWRAIVPSFEPGAAGTVTVTFNARYLAEMAAALSSDAGPDVVSLQFNVEPFPSEKDGEAPKRLGLRGSHAAMMVRGSERAGLGVLMPVTTEG